MADTRFSISKKYGTSEVTFFGGEANQFSIPVNGIPGLASYGFASLLEAQLVGGPRTPDYVADTAAALSVYLSEAWKPGDSAGIMRRKFQLARAVSVLASKKQRKPVSFAAVLPSVMALSDEQRQALWLDPKTGIPDVVAKWNFKSERKAVDVSAAFKTLIG